jgi:hypothetical protein
MLSSLSSMHRLSLGLVLSIIVGLCRFVGAMGGLGRSKTYFLPSHRNPKALILNVYDLFVDLRDLVIDLIAPRQFMGDQDSRSPNCGNSSTVSKYAWSRTGFVLAGLGRCEIPPKADVCLRGACLSDAASFATRVPRNQNHCSMNWGYWWLAWINLGMKVLDPFKGVNGMAEAARFGVDGIGFDIDATYSKTARENLSGMRGPKRSVIGHRSFLRPLENHDIHRNRNAELAEFIKHQRLRLFLIEPT